METELISIIQSIFDFFYSPWTKALCCIFLIASAIGLWFGRSQNGGIFKVFVPMMIGTLLFMCAGALSIGVGNMIGRIYGIDFSEKITVPKITISTKTSKTQISTSSNNSTITESQSSTSSSSSTSNSETSGTSTSSSSGTSSESSSNTSGSANKSDSTSSSSGSSSSSSFSASDYVNTHSAKDSNAYMQDLMKQATYETAVSTIKKNSTSVSEMTLLVGGVSISGTNYNDVNGCNYLVANNGNIYTQLNKDYKYDKDGNLLKLSSTKEYLDAMQESMASGEDLYSWKLLRTKDE